MPNPVTTGKPPINSGRFCQCSVCCESFSSLEAFDAHRVGRHQVKGERRCLVPSPRSEWVFNMVEYHHGTYWQLSKEKRKARREELLNVLS